MTYVTPTGRVMQDEAAPQPTAIEKVKSFYADNKKAILIIAAVVAIFLIYKYRAKFTL